MAVFIHKALLPIVGDLRAEAVPTGIGDTVGNKGAAAV